MTMKLTATMMLSVDGVDGVHEAPEAPEEPVAGDGSRRTKTRRSGGS
jgi:hypothetical protein